MKKISFPWKRKKTPTGEQIDLDTGEITNGEEQSLNESDVTEHIEGERGLPSVNKATSVQARLTNAITVILVVVLAVFLLYRYYNSMWQHKKEEAAAKGVDKTKTAAVQLPPLQKPPAEEAPFGLTAPEPPPISPRAAVSKPGASNTDPASTNVPPLTADSRPVGPDGKPILTPEEQAAKRKLTAPVSFKLDAGGTAPRVMRVNGQRTGGGTDETMVRNEQLADALKPTYTPGVKASVLPDRDLMVTKGTFLECVLEQAIDTKLAGMVSCLLSKDVYGASGNVVLMEKGTKLTGEYHGEIKGNDGRIFVLWSLAETPQGVTIELASPGTDALGRSGIDGYVDTHFKERFGAAILVSLIEDASTAWANRQQSVNGNNNTITTPSTQKNAQSMAQEILKQDSAIPATLTKNQGARISVFVARHLDFRGVYKLERAR